MNEQTSRPIVTKIAASLVALGFVVSIAVPASAGTLGVQTTCSGSTPDGWSFVTDALDSKFLHVIWTGPQGHRRISVLEYYSTNAEDFPVYKGTLQEGVDVILVDEASGVPTSGTTVQLYLKEWGWIGGTCEELTTETLAYEPFKNSVRQNILGSRDAAATNWLRRNGFTLDRVIQLTNTGKTERWRRDPDNSVLVVFYRGRISDVVADAQ